MIEWPRRLALVVWVLILAGVFGRVAAARIGAQSVVPIYAMAGERWWNGEPLYAAPPPGLDVYRNPPGFAALFAALAQLPPRFVAIAWRAVGIGLLALGLRRFLAAVNPVSLAPRAGATVWIVAALFALPALNNGQVNLFVVAAALLGTAAAARGMWWQASAWVMLAAWLKVYPIALAGLFAILAPRRFLGRSIIVGAALVALPFAFRNPEYVAEQHGAFWEATRADERGEAPLERTMKGWTYLVRIGTGHGVSPGALQVVAAFAGLMLAGVIGLAVLRNGSPPALFGLALGSALLWMVIFGPATETNTYSLLAPLGWLAVADGPPRGNRVMAWCGIASVLAGDIAGLAALQPLGAMLLFAASVRAMLALRSERSD